MRVTISHYPPGAENRPSVRQFRLGLPLQLCGEEYTKLFYKRECQEKYSPAELEAGENRLAFSPLYRSMAASVVCRVTHPEGSSLLGPGAGRFAGFHSLPFPLVRMCSSERRGAVKGAPTGAAKRTLDGEDRSATIGQEEKEIAALSVPEDAASSRDAVCQP